MKASPVPAFWCVIAIAAAILLLRAGGAPLTDPDESRFARTSVEMLRSGDPVVPRFGGEPRLVKPPLIHWIQSSVFRLTGPVEWAARLHAALATLGSILLVGWVGWRRFGPEGGSWSAAVLATMPIVVVPGRTGTIDALLALHVFAIVALDLALPDERSTTRDLTVGGLLGLAFLAKGPVGVALPLLLLLAGRTAAGRNVLPPVDGTLRAVAAWALIVLPWGLAFIRRVGVDTVVETLRTETVERYFAPEIHGEPAWYYGKIVAVGFLPWLAPLLLGLVRAFRLRRQPVARTALYAGAALLAGLVFFTLGKSKLPSYLLPLAPLAAVLITWELAREIESPRERTLGPTLLAATLGAGAVLLGLAGGLRLAGEARTTALAGAVILGVGSLVAGWAAIVRRPRWVHGSAAGSCALFLLVAVVVLFPSIGNARSAAPLIDAVPLLASGRPLVTVEIQVPSLTFYLENHPEVIEMERFDGRIAADDDPLFVLADVDLPAARAAGVLERLEEVGRHGKYVVLQTPMPEGLDRLDGQSLPR